MKLTPIKPAEAFPLTSDQRLSFDGVAQPYRVSGPPGLVRLVQRGRRKDGEFWFEEPVFTKLRAKAKADLLQQTGTNQDAFSRPLKELIGMYMKHCLRQDLAICKNWTENFDSYVVLPLRPIDSLVAWVGKIKDQPYYEKPQRAQLTKAEFAEQTRIHERAEAGGTSLVASEQQYVVNFSHAANRAFAGRILGPFEF